MIKIPDDKAIEKANRLGGQQYMVVLESSVNIPSIDTFCKRAIAQEATRYALEQVREWGDEDCTEKEHYEFHVKKRECPICWQELK